MADEVPKEEKLKPPAGFSPEQRAIIRKWIEDHWVMKKCPMCGIGNFIAASYIVHPKSLTVDREPTDPVGYFFIPINCDNCYYTLLLNAVPLGLWTKYQPDAK